MSKLVRFHNRPKSITTFFALYWYICPLNNHNTIHNAYPQRGLYHSVLGLLVVAPHQCDYLFFYRENDTQDFQLFPQYHFVFFSSSIFSFSNQKTASQFLHHFSARGWKNRGYSGSHGGRIF